MSAKRLITCFVCGICCCLVWAQQRKAQSVGRRADSVRVECGMDSCRIEVIPDSVGRNDLCRWDSLHYSLRQQKSFEEVFHFQYDAFREQMKEPWLGDLLRCILF